MTVAQRNYFHSQSVGLPSLRGKLKIISYNIGLHTHTHTLLNHGGSKPNICYMCFSNTWITSGSPVNCQDCNFLKIINLINMKQSG